MNDSLISAFRYHRSYRYQTAARALYLARLDVANGVKRYAAPARSGFTRPEPYPPQGTRRRHFDDLAGSGFRLVGFADEIVRLGHTGWHTDDPMHGGETYRAAVVQVAGRKGKARLLTAYLESESLGYVIDVSDITEVISDGHLKNESETAYVAQAADSMAENAADNERRYQEVWRKGSRFAELGEEIAEARQLRRDYRKALKALRVQEARARLQVGATRKAAGGVPPLALQALRLQIEQTWRICETAHTERESILESVWQYCDYDAFNEGAGEEVLKPR